MSSLVNAQHDLSAVTSSDLRATVRDTILDATKGAMPQTLIAFHRGTVWTATLYTDTVWDGMTLHALARLIVKTVHSMKTLLYTSLSITASALQEILHEGAVEGLI